MPDLKPDHLIIRYLSNEASAIDQEHLFDWVSRSQENQSVFNAYVAAWTKQAHTPDSFDLQRALAALNTKIDAYELQENKKTVFWNRWNIAAAVIFIITAGFVLYHTGKSAYQTHADTLLTEFVTTTQRDTITLSDGSVITLNINSALTYPETFSAANREVYLTGEAFFEVARDSSKPFIIHTRNITTQVTGTSFNINTTASSIIVSVATGSVTVSDGSATEALKPYEKIVYAEKAFSKTTTDLSELAWYDRTLRFDETPLEEVIEKLAQHYDVRIILKNEALKKCSLTGKFTNEPLDAILQAMEYSLGTQARHVNDTIILSGNGCQ
jgi:ferric-dicitrate binding protein FerR (iron transport regulator)